MSALPLLSRTALFNSDIGLDCQICVHSLLHVTVEIEGVALRLSPSYTTTACGVAQKPFNTGRFDVEKQTCSQEISERQVLGPRVVRSSCRSLPLRTGLAEPQHLALQLVVINRFAVWIRCLLRREECGLFQSQPCVQRWRCVTRCWISAHSAFVHSSAGPLSRPSTSAASIADRPLRADATNATM